jgi:uncharacterized membrane protein
MKILKYVGLTVVFIWFAIGGAYHFINPDFFVRIVPPYVPWPLAAVYVSGVFELAGAVGIVHPKWRSRAGIGLFVLTLCVTPANVHMWMNPELFPTISESALGFRLVLQVALLACIWWSTQSRANDPHSEGARP